jgi:cell wall assembly regulator SMI1
MQKSIVKICIVSLVKWIRNIETDLKLKMCINKMRKNYVTNDCNSADSKVNVNNFKRCANAIKEIVWRDCILWMVSRVTSEGKSFPASSHKVYGAITNRRDET